jgi:hypothetical protein
LRSAPSLPRVASTARAKTTMFRRLRRSEELYVFRMRTARRAGWAAINSSGTYGVDERAVHASVSRRNCQQISAAARGGHRKRSGWPCHGSLESFLQHNTEAASLSAIRILRANFFRIRPFGDAQTGRCALGQFGRSAN